MARATLRQRWRDWWLARHPRTDTWTLSQRNVYILPTKGGLVFALTLLVMLLASINYQLNLGYVLTFLLAGAGLVSIHLTHGTLRGLTLRLKPPAPVFAGEAAALEVVLSSPGGTRHGIGLHFHDGQHEQRNAWCDVPALGQASARLAIVPGSRGLHEVPALVVETRFPFGLFRAWSIWRPASAVLAWPAPEKPRPPLPAARTAGTDLRQARRGAGAELDGVRAWRRGDSLRQVVWKKAARTGELVSRETAAEGSHELDLDWHAAAGAGGADARLARLCAWVLEADREGLAYGLRLPGARHTPGRGDGHRRELLKALALWR
jgi:uncharacterized protein (DUF58 family)